MNIQREIISILHGLKDAFAPARCMDCLLEGTWYCAHCRHKAPVHSLRCIGCEAHRPRGTTCLDCKEEISLTGVVSAGPYSHQALLRGIEWLKFKGIRPIASVLAGLLIPRLHAIAPIDILTAKATLVPIPLHAKRYRSRGFNQSEDIARAISSLCSIEVSPLLTRSRATASQAHLPHDLRPHNVDQAFSLAVSEEEYLRRIRSKPIIILVDDVSTTGSTLISAASAFPPLSEAHIWGAAVAQG